jgi:hypothetical protein
MLLNKFFKQCGLNQVKIKRENEAFCNSKERWNSGMLE